MVDKRDGSRAVVRLFLFLFERTTKTASVGVAVHMEQAGAVGDGVSVGEDDDELSGMFGEDVAHDLFHGGRKRKFDSFRSKEVVGRIRLDK